MLLYNVGCGLIELRKSLHPVQCVSSNAFFMIPLISKPGWSSSPFRRIGDKWFRKRVLTQLFCLNISIWLVRTIQVLASKSGVYSMTLLIFQPDLSSSPCRTIGDKWLCKCFLRCYFKHWCGWFELLKSSHPILLYILWPLLLLSRFRAQTLAGGVETRCFIHISLGVVF